MYLDFFKLKYLELMIYSLIISSIFAFFSWHFIEKKALKLKNLRPILFWQWVKMRKYRSDMGELIKVK